MGMGTVIVVREQRRGKPAKIYPINIVAVLFCYLVASTYLTNRQIKYIGKLGYKVTFTNEDMKNL